MELETEEEESEEEPMKEHVEFLIEKRLMWLYENNQLELATMTDSELVELANKLASKYHIRLNGFLPEDTLSEMPDGEAKDRFRNSAWFTVAGKRGTTFLFDLRKPEEELAKKLKEIEASFKPKEMEPV